MRAPRSLVSLVFVLALAACGGGGDEIGDGPAGPADTMFAEAQADLDAGRPRAAAIGFTEVEQEYPFSEWARRAMIQAAYAYYTSGDYEESRSAAQRFLEFYPADPDAAYARYLIALGYYDQILDVGRDQRDTIDALQALRAVFERHPESEYARDAQLKFDLALDHLAGKEMEIGRYYLARSHYTAAIGRFRAVVEEFDTTSHTEEALHRLVEAYMALGFDEEARRAALILATNYPGSEWYERSFALLQSAGASQSADDDGTLPTIWRRVIRGEWL
ncbi:MAG: outer membrane protein assembly factor BamD [Rubricella sp.]